VRGWDFVRAEHPTGKSQVGKMHRKPEAVRIAAPLPDEGPRQARHRFVEDRAFFGVRLEPLEMGHAVHFEKRGLARADAVRERSPRGMVPLAAQQYRHRPEGPRRVAPEELTHGRQREAVAVMLGEHTHRREGAHQTVERRGMHPHDSRDLVRRPRAVRELFSHVQFRSGGQRLGDKLAGDEVHEHRGRR